MAALTSQEAMLLAIKEGERGAGFVSPNPLVGCVILDRDGRLLAKGHHARLGEGHAEVNALKEIEDPNRLDGAHVYVTLEPCAHEGRTPSCAKALAKLPIASVTYGLRDPNPLVAGQGAEILRAAGKKVAVFEGLQAELQDLAEIFLLNMKFKRPFVALKVGSSLDGQIAMKDGTSQWITGEDSRTRVQYLRGSYDAVLTGVGTFLRDDPRLNSRDPRFVEKPSRVILLDPTGKSYDRLAKSALVQVRRPEDLTVVTGPGISAPPVGQHLQVTDNDRDFDLNDLLDQLYQNGIYSLMIEGGPRTASAFLKHRKVDRLYLFMAPKILGQGMSWTAGLAIPSLESSLKLKNTRVTSYGEDVLVTGTLAANEF